MKSNNCTKRTKDTLIKVEENKRKALFKNPSKSEYEVTQIDGCLIKDGLRSDFLVSEKNIAPVLVELKGSDVAHAINQLLSTVEHESINRLIYKKLGFLVLCSRYPRFDTCIAKAKQKCAKKYKAGFHVVCDQRQFDIKRVVEIDGPH